MTHVTKWVLTVHTKSRTENPAQQVIPDGPGMVSHDIQYTIHRIQILQQGSTKLYERVMISTMVIESWSRPLVLSQANTPRSTKVIDDRDPPLSQWVMNSSIVVKGIPDQ